MQAVMTLPAVLLWGQPFEPEKEKGEGEANKDEKPTEETELVTQNGTGAVEKDEPEDDFNLCTDISFWCWLFGTTFWSLGTYMTSIQGSVGQDESSWDEYDQF